MKINVETGKIENVKTDAAILPVFEDEKPGRIAERVDKALGGTIQKLIKRGDFKPKVGTAALIYPEGKIAAERLILAGLGKRADVTLDRLRQAAGKAAPYARMSGARNFAFVTDGFGLDPQESAQALTEGSVLGLYRFLKYKTDEENDRKKEVEEITFLTEAASLVRTMQKGVSTGEVIAGATVMARDMVNHPSADMTPTVIAGIARDIAKKHKLRLQVLEKKQMQRLGMARSWAWRRGAHSRRSSSSWNTAAGGKNRSSPSWARPLPSIPAAFPSRHRRTRKG